jgi:carboxymethylenebutenolidase
MKYSEPPKPVFPPQPQVFAPGLALLRPLTRKGTGPGLIVLVDDVAAGIHIRNGVPSPLMKWAEEGYTVIEITSQAWASFSHPIDECVARLGAPGVCEDPDRFGFVCYSESLWPRLASSASRHEAIVALVLYTDSPESIFGSEAVPILIHSKVDVASKSAASKIYTYPEQASSLFATPFTREFNYAAEAISHTRNLSFLKRCIGGPYFDLEAIWDEHTYYEFEARSVEHTMNTMVAEPYVNHIPTVCGPLSAFSCGDQWQSR